MKNLCQKIRIFICIRKYFQSYISWWRFFDTSIVASRGTKTYVNTRNYMDLKQRIAKQSELYACHTRTRVQARAPSMLITFFPRMWLTRWIGRSRVYMQMGLVLSRSIHDTSDESVLAGPCPLRKSPCHHEKDTSTPFAFRFHPAFVEFHMSQLYNFLFFFFTCCSGIFNFIYTWKIIFWRCYVTRVLKF